MRKALFAVGTAMAVFGGSQLGAATYTDTTGENFTGAGGGILDISSVEVNNNATDLIFKINLTGDPVATDWGKYMIGISTFLVPSDPVSNGWGRPISAAGGMNYWIGSWVDGGNGVQVFNFPGSWNMTAANGPFAGPGATPAFFPGLSITKNTSSVTITAPLSLIIAPGNFFFFDVYTSGGGGGDSAVDALNNPLQSISDWPGPYTSGTTALYTITAVPEPSLLAFLALGGVAMGGYLFRRKI